MLKRKGLLIFALVLILSSFAVPAFGSDSISVDDSLAEIVSYYANNKTALDNWEEVVGLAKAGENISSAPWQLPDWGIDSLESSSSGTYAATILGIMAAGQDPANVDGRNLVQELTLRQTDSGAFGEYITDTIWAMIALDEAHGTYDINKAATYLINQQTDDGGFALSGDSADPDITGFVLIALSPHTDIEWVSATINSAKLSLQNMQLDNGGFSSWGTENTETIVTVIRGLLACGEDITNDTWKNGKMIDALYAFQLDDKSFSHTIGGNYNKIATRQALIAVADMVNANIDYQIGESGQSGGGAADEVTVRVRVEGAASNLADEAITVQGKALDALKAAVEEDNVQLDQYGMVGTILGESGQHNVAAGIDTSWMYYVMRDGAIEPAAFSEGPGSFTIEDGDEIVFYIGAYDNTTWDAWTYFPEISFTPTEPVAGQSLVLNVSARKNVWGVFQDLSQDEITNIGEYTLKVGATEYHSTNGTVTIPNITQGTHPYTISNPSPAGYPDVITYTGSIEVKSASGGGGSTPTWNTAYLIVVGDKEHGLILDRYPIRWSDNNYCLEDALEETFNANNIAFINNGGYLASIGGLTEKKPGYPLSGWKYKVDGIIKDYGISSYIIQNGDKIMVYYALTMDDPGPPWDNPLEPGNNQIAGNIAEAARLKIDEYANTLKELQDTNKILNANYRMSTSDAIKLKDTLINNQVSLNEKVGQNGIFKTDDAEEVTLTIPANALTDEKNITIKELDAAENASEFAVKVASSVYEFGPGGTNFDKPVTISIKVPITEDLDIEQLTPAWYDEKSKQWVSIPAIVDLKEGLVVFQINHFTKFAVIELSEPIKEPEVIKENRKTFSDVNEKMAWAKDAIEILAGRGIIQGTGTEAFEPQRPVTRAEFVKLAVTALQLKTEEYKNGLFNDVYDSNWFAPSAATAYHNRIVSGYPDGSFRPDQSISRNEIASIFYQMEGGPDTEDIKLNYQDLADIPAWTLKGVRYMNKQGLMSGYEDGTFRGQNQLTRAEAAVVIYKYVNLVWTL